MVVHVPILHEDQNLHVARELIEKKAKSYDTLDYLYGTNDTHTVTGAVSIKDIYSHPSDHKIKDIYKNKKFISIHPDAEREDAVRLALAHGIKTIPIVDDTGALLGVIPSSTILKIIHKEFHEDMLKLSGVNAQHAEYDNVLDVPTRTAIMHRLPWLVIGIIGGLATAGIIEAFESTLQKNIILAAFIPLIVYIGDAVRTQLQSFTIRDLALARSIDMRLYLRKQTTVTMTIAVALGITLAIVSMLFHSNIKISLVLGLAVVIATCSTLATGILFPRLSRSLHIDPADSSGPIGTIIQDIFSVLIYLTIASIVL